MFIRTAFDFWLRALGPLSPFRPGVLVQHVGVLRGCLDPGMVESVLDELQIPGRTEQACRKGVAVVVPAVVCHAGLLPAATPVCLEALEGFRMAPAAAAVSTGALH